METPSWLNEKFLERVLRRSENDDSICVTNLSSKPATNKGDNYTSDMIRVSVEFNRNIKGKAIPERMSIIVKIAPTTNGAHKDMIEQSGIFDIEMKMMTTTLREMEFILKDTKLGGNCLFTQQKDPPILIIEDLAPLGFRMADRQVGLDLQHTILALKGLAKFHASSVAVCERMPKYKEMYNKGIFNTENPPELSKFFANAMKTLTKSIASWPGLDQHYAEKLAKLSDVAYAKASESRKLDVNEFNVINHGDFWVNNMLFKYDDNNKVIDHIFVDFQLCVYGTPAIDLTYFLNTSPSETVLLNHKNQVIEEYLNSLIKTMRKLGCRTPPPTMVEIKKAMHKCEMYGFLAACTILPLLLVDKSESQNLEEIMGQDEDAFNNKAYDNKQYEKTMTRRLIKWNEMGLLDQ